MRIVPSSLSFQPELAFKYIAGDPSLDFVNTVDWTEDGLVEDRLTDHGRLLEWAAQAGILSASERTRLRAAALRSPAAAQAAFEAARRTRWTIRRTFEAVVGGKRSDDALREFNALLGDAHSHLELTWLPAGARPTRARPGAPLHWGWRDGDDELSRVLWSIVRAAGTLLTSDEASRVRICGGPRCGWMYVDRSRNGLRRWCEMSVCGTREKSRRRAVRRSADQ